MIKVHCESCGKDLGEVEEKPEQAICWDCYYGKKD